MATDYIGIDGRHHYIDDGLYCLKYSEADALVTEELLRKQFMEEKEMGNNKIVTLIGSMSETNKAAMIALFNRLTLKGDFVNLPYMDRVSEDASDDQINTLHSIHEYKMGKADLVIVVDADGHVGKDTQREINWCDDHGKNIIYLSDMQVYEPANWACAKETKGGKRS